VTRSWHRYLTLEDLAIVERARFGRRIGFGVRPAVLVIDAQRYMIGDEGNDAAWPSSCGAAGRAAVKTIARLVAVAHAARVPCFFTLFELARDGRDMGVYRRKRDLLQGEHWCLEGSLGARMVSELEPGSGDIVLVKKKPSSFQGTPLLAYLVDRGIDTLIVTGGSTSNCVRATVFDSSSYNFRTIVVEEGVFDRLPISHAISLFDMDRQWADVVPMAEVVAYLEALPPVP
jgi:nicotinamidase-related amidase